MRRQFALLHRPDDFFVGVHIDRVVVGRAAELALLWGGGIAERHAQAAADTQIDANRTHHPAIAIGFLDNAAGDGTRRLANRTRKGPKTGIRIDDRDRLRGLLARPRHHFGPHYEELYRKAGGPDGRPPERDKPYPAFIRR